MIAQIASPDFPAGVLRDGCPLADLQMTQASLADSEAEVDAAALLVYRAAWVKDRGAARIAREASIAKMYATEIAQRIGYQPQSLLCVPLPFEDTVIGVLELLDKEGGAGFDDTDIHALSLFAAQAAGVEMSWGQQLVMMLTLMITSKGVAAVPLASLVILAGTLTQFKLPLEAVAVIFGVDTIMDMARTTVNLIGNCLATCVMARWEGEFDDTATGQISTTDGHKEAQEVTKS